MHLGPEELIDIAEGARSKGAAPHLAGCETCRRQIVELRAMMASVVEDDVPEPSPLFWDRLATRVREATAAEPAARGWSWWTRAALPFALATAVAILIALVATTRLIAPNRSAPPATAFVAAPPPPQPAPSGVDMLGDVTDPSLALVAELSDGMEWDAPRDGAEHAVTHLNEAELRRLRDLLQEELANSGD